jgi:Tfp pilus assembly protein PilF
MRRARAGVVIERMSDLNAAITRLEATLAREGGSAASFNELGALKLAGGDAEGAIIAYLQCLTFASQNAAIYNNLGTALVKAGRFDAAITALETALALRQLERPANHE